MFLISPSFRASGELCVVIVVFPGNFTYILLLFVGSCFSTMITALGYREPNALLCFSMVYNACAVLCSLFPFPLDVTGSYAL